MNNNEKHVTTLKNKSMKNNETHLENNEKSMRNNEQHLENHEKSMNNNEKHRQIMNNK
jgi:hypothetical protein